VLSDPRGIWIKVDGVTRMEDVAAAVDAGASAIGMIFAESSRRLDLERAAPLRKSIPDSVLAFGVFGPVPAAEVVRMVDELRLDGAQLPARSAADPEGCVVLRTVRVRSASDLSGLERLRCDAVHLDAFVAGKLGGTGQLAPWDVIEAGRPQVPFVLSGGLRAENVGEAISRLCPAGVDVASGVESAPGIKDHSKLRAFVREARRS
jgi:phosphoribosylanthranilate isomerase